MKKKLFLAVFVLLSVMNLEADVLRCDDLNKLICLVAKQEPLYTRVYAINMSNNDIAINGSVQIMDKTIELEEKIIRANSKIIIAEADRYLLKCTEKRLIHIKRPHYMANNRYQGKYGKGKRFNNRWHIKNACVSRWVYPKAYYQYEIIAK